MRAHEGAAHVQQSIKNEMQIAIFGARGALPLSKDMERVFDGYLGELSRVGSVSPAKRANLEGALKQLAERHESAESASSVSTRGSDTPSPLLSSPVPASPGKARRGAGL